MDIGDKVKCGGDYRGEIGTITSIERNMLGFKLFIVQLACRKDDEYKPCFYPYELEKL